MRIDRAPSWTMALALSATELCFLFAGWGGVESGLGLGGGRVHVEHPARFPVLGSRIRIYIYTHIYIYVYICVYIYTH